MAVRPAEVRVVQTLEERYRGGIVNGLQRGRRSPGFAGGVFTPVHDGPAERFSVWVAARTG